jgi:hypothetical protein
MVREKEITYGSSGAGLTFVRFVLPAGEAVSAPPLSATLGQIQVNSADFCKQFNIISQTLYEAGTLLNVHLFKQADGSFYFKIRGIFLPFLIFQGANSTKILTVETLYDIFRISSYGCGNYSSFFNAKCFYGSMRSINFKILL